MTAHSHITCKFKRTLESKTNTSKSSKQPSNRSTSSPVSKPFTPHTSPLK